MLIKRQIKILFIKSKKKTASLQPFWKYNFCKVSSIWHVFQLINIFTQYIYIQIYSVVSMVINGKLHLSKNKNQTKCFCFFVSYGYKPKLVNYSSKLLAKWNGAVVAGKLVACWKQFDKLDDDNE
jgi:hypothetical protein